MAYTTIDKPSDYFNTVLYTGNGSTQSITGVGFQPDWTWIKSRSNTTNHQAVDSVRGNTKALFPDLTNAETTYSQGITSFDSDGFSLGNLGGYNGSGFTFASWNWLAGGTAVTNNDGATASSVSANPTAGFSVITHTGTGSATNFGHGLNQTPELVITKSRTLVGGNWNTWYKSFTATQVVRLQVANAITTDASSYGTVPDSSVIYVGSSNHTNQSGQSILTYAFHSVKGYSKIDSYTGNGTLDNGPFVYCGFKPAWVLIKRTNSTGSWQMNDNKRDSYNSDSVQSLFADLNNAEASSTGNDIDFVSNGFKLMGNGTGTNASGGSYIYLAFAESPFTTSTAIPTTAR